MCLPLVKNRAFSTARFFHAHRATRGVGKTEAASANKRSSSRSCVPIYPVNLNQDGTVKTNTEPPSHVRPITAVVRTHTNTYTRKSDRHSRSLYLSYDLGGQPSRHSLRRIPALFGTRCASGPAFCSVTNDVAASCAAVGIAPSGSCARDRAILGQYSGRHQRPTQHTKTGTWARTFDAHANPNHQRGHRISTGRLRPPYQRTRGRYPAVLPAPARTGQSSQL